MSKFFSWQSPEAPLVLNAVLDSLAEVGYDGLSLAHLRTKLGAAGKGLDATVDVDALVVAALEDVELFQTPTPTGRLREDLRTLLEPLRTAPGRDERAVAAVLGPATRRPRLRVAVHEALDRPLTHRIATMVNRSTAHEHVPTQVVQTLCWVLRGVLVNRLRASPRTPWTSTPM